MSAIIVLYFFPRCCRFVQGVRARKDSSKLFDTDPYAFPPFLSFLPWNSLIYQRTLFRFVFFFLVRPAGLAVQSPFLQFITSFIVTWHRLRLRCLVSSLQSGFLSILYSIGSQPLQIWDKKCRNGHIKRITDNDIQSSVLEIMGTNVSKKLPSHFRLVTFKTACSPCFAVSRRRR